MEQLCPESWHYKNNDGKAIMINLKHSFWLLLIFTPINVLSAEVKPGYYFDVKGFMDEDIDVTSFNDNEDQVLPGVYPLAVYVNNSYLGRFDVKFSKGDSHSVIEMDKSEIALIGIKSSIFEPLAEGWQSIEKIIPDASFRYDSYNLTLYLSIPQVYFSPALSGAPKSTWDHGINAAYVNYNANHYNSVYHGSSSESQQLNTDSGVNINGWYFRNSSFYNKVNDSGRWHSIQSYLKHPVAEWNSEVLVGQSYSGGQYLDSFGFIGMKISSDSRMNKTAYRGFIPTVRGIARTNALVKVSQKGAVLLQESVAMGPFELTNFHPLGFGGDLEVEVIETDGSIQSFTVPYSSIPDLMSDGISSHSISIGQFEESGVSSSPSFLQGEYARGFSQGLTAYSSALLSENYYAAMLGGAVNTELGAFSLDVTSSVIDSISLGRKQGYSLKASHSKLFKATDTLISLAAYRYSSRYFYSFSSANRLDESGFYDNDSNKSRFDLSITQSAGQWGSFYVSGSTYNYWNELDSTSQYSLGHSISLKNLSINNSISFTDNDALYMLSLSVPINSIYVSSNLSSSRLAGESAGMSMSGLLGDKNQVSYSAAATKTRNGDIYTINSRATLNEGILMAGVSNSHDSTQYSVGMNGSLIAHKDGVILGQPLSESAAIVVADDASGSRVSSANNVVLNHFGQAVVPFIQPYDFNKVELDPTTAEHQVDLPTTSKKIAPYAGAIVRVDFETQVGNKVIVETTLENGDYPPVGASIKDDQGRLVGMVGHQGLIYFSSPSDTVRLNLSWRDKGRCNINFIIDHKLISDPKMPFIVNNVICHNMDY